MTCECCHCCFCCCEQNYDNNPNPTKKPKVETPVTRTTQIPKPPVVTDRSEPVIQWPDELIPGPPTVEEWMERPPIEIIRANNDAAEEEEQFSFPPKTPDEPPPPVLGCMDPLATNYNALATQSDGSCVYPPPPCPVYTQYTPYTWRKIPNATPAQGNNPANRIIAGTSVSRTVNIDEGPPAWIPQSDWNAMYWDGVPLTDIYNKTPSQLCVWMFKGRAMKGLKQHYEAIKPFCDPANPTVAEVDNWHLEVIKHFRNLLGVTTPIQLDARLMLESAWAEERYWLQFFWASYTGTNGSAYGPCVGTTNQHCGASFIPSIVDQQPYYTQYPDITPTMTQSSRAEGIGNQNTNLPWMLKLVGVLQNWVCSEGLVGHTGPFVTREKVGMSIFAGADGLGPSSRFRIKWS